MKNLFLLPALLAGLCLIPGRLTAQTFTTLHNFAGSDGVNPQAGLVLSGNTLYGATDSGGSFGHGAVFAVNINGSGFTTLYSFTGGTDGHNPDGTLLLSGSTLYGTSYYGGVTNIYNGIAGIGAVFAISTSGTGFRNVYSFRAGNTNSSGVYTNSDGADPEVGLILSGNTLYGTTENGGSSGNGTVFAVNTDGTGFTTLHSFTGGVNGSVPEGLLLSGGTLYGVAVGFNSGIGTVFKINTNGTGFAILHTFSAISTLGLILSGNTLYGTTYNDGVNGNGTVFAVNTDGSGFTNLYSFTATSGSNLTNSDGANPIENGGLILSGNTLYGTTQNGGSSGNGTVFAVSTNGTGFTTLYNFTAESSGINSDGANPYAGLTLSGNILYGTAENGGTSGDGTVFSLSLPSFIFGSQVQSTPSASITFLSGTGAFQYTDSANLSDDFAALPLAGNAATFITTSNGWFASLTVNLSARSMPGNGDDVYAAMGLYVVINGNFGIFNDNVKISLNQENNTGSGDNGNLYGTAVLFEAVNNGQNISTTPLGNSSNLNGTSYQGLSGGGTSSSPITEAISAVSGVLTFTNNPSTDTLTGYYNGNPVGSISLASWGSNPSLTLCVVGFSGWGVSVPAGTDTASNFFAGTLPVFTSAPVFQSAKLANGRFMLTWSAVSNGVYQLQYKTNLLQTNWINIGSNITASNTVLTVTNNINTDNQRFYRVQQQ